MCVQMSSGERGTICMCNDVLSDLMVVVTIVADLVSCSTHKPVVQVLCMATQPVTCLVWRVDGQAGGQLDGWNHILFITIVCAGRA